MIINWNLVSGGTYPLFLISHYVLTFNWVFDREDNRQIIPQSVRSEILLLWTTVRELFNSAFLGFSVLFWSISIFMAKHYFARITFLSSVIFFSSVKRKKKKKWDFFFLCGSMWKKKSIFMRKWFSSGSPRKKEKSHLSVRASINMPYIVSFNQLRWLNCPFMAKP